MRRGESEAGAMLLGEREGMGRKAEGPGSPTRSKAKAELAGGGSGGRGLGGPLLRTSVKQEAESPLQEEGTAGAGFEESQPQASRGARPPPLHTRLSAPCGALWQNMSRVQPPSSCTTTSRGQPSLRSPGCCSLTGDPASTLGPLWPLDESSQSDPLRTCRIPSFLGPKPLAASHLLRTQ